ncbi:hypothetical protein [Nonomuraea africana]|uniref:Uncharacterized protein n=1 Tax=Nonomuraea africana TaxID=46171 RepID=A0ABR9KDH8_9ACTN|nr:hypothetical protein [Nonomuraea africana]MBE1560074.1 hypothetical protein [Nonomuraea africana]
MADLTSAERELTEVLSAWAAFSPAPADHRYGSLYELLLDVGEWFTPAALPPGVGRGPMGFCNGNAAETVAQGWPDARGWIYVEGFALVATGGNRLPVPHAWVCPASGRTAMEVTWPPGRGMAYLGDALSPAVWTHRPPYDSSPLLDAHERRELLRVGLPNSWHVRPEAELGA